MPPTLAEPPPPASPACSVPCLAAQRRVWVAARANSSAAVPAGDGGLASAKEEAGLVTAGRRLHVSRACSAPQYAVQALHLPPPPPALTQRSLPRVQPRRRRQALRRAEQRCRVARRQAERLLKRGGGLGKGAQGHVDDAALWQVRQGAERSQAHMAGAPLGLASEPSAAPSCPLPRAPGPGLSAAPSPSSCPLPRAAQRPLLHLDAGVHPPRRQLQRPPIRLDGCCEAAQLLVARRQALPSGCMLWKLQVRQAAQAGGQARCALSTTHPTPPSTLRPTCIPHVRPERRLERGDALLEALGRHQQVSGAAVRPARLPQATAMQGGRGGEGGPASGRAGHRHICPARSACMQRPAGAP